MPSALPRAKVPAAQTWNAESVFASPAEFEAEARRLLAGLPRLRRFQGRLAEGPAVLRQVLRMLETLGARAYKLIVYAVMSSAVDTGDQTGAGLYGRAASIAAQLDEAAAFLEPELIALGEPVLRGWLAAEPKLKLYTHFVNELFRKQAHVRSAEVEELLGALGAPFDGPRGTATFLANADFKFPPARDSRGRPVKLTQSTYDAILNTGDRRARQTAWENYTDTYLAFKNTLASNLVTSLKQNVFLTRTRRFASSLDYTLFSRNVPPAMFHNLIAIFKQNLPLWHRYWRIRRRALGVRTLHPYDVWAPLTARPPRVPFAQAVDWICAGLAPLGADYVATVRRGCLTERWVDWAPNAGKRQGAFSIFGPADVHPFILMSYTDDVGSVSTLAHELGHSMHAYYFTRAQPLRYCECPSIIFETASNLHQALTRAHLLQANPSREFQIALLEEAMDNFHRYFFIMPTLARFELETHQRIERGEALTADGMMALMADLFSEGYGADMHLDRQRVGITWGTFTTHLYIDYYAFQYAIGISAANAIAQRILTGVPGAAQAHIDFLKAGSSRPPLEVFKLAGVDMATPQPIEAAFAMLGSYVDRLEELLG